MKPETPETSLPQTLAIVRDGRRRGGLRVARARVIVAFDWCARVREIRTRTEHWLPLDVLAKRSRRAGRILRELIEDQQLSTSAEEAQSAAAQPLAGKAAAVEPVA